MLDTVAIITTITALFAFLNYKIVKLPTTIGVMAITLSISLVFIALKYFGFDGIANSAMELSSKIDFNQVVMDGMLSFLLFAGALHVNLNELSEKKWAILLMSTLGVLITTFLFGYASFYIFSYVGVHVPLIYCLAFGALISATDPIAVLGILKTSGAPKSLTVKCIGESLFNDGVAYVVFIVLSGIAVGTTELDPLAISILFVEEAFGGVAFGLLIGGVAYGMLKSIDNYQVEVLITLALVLGGYAFAQHIHISGPIAIVVAGLMIGNHGRMFAMSSQTRDHLDTFWELIDEILNAVLFVMIGIEILAINYSPLVFISGLILIPTLLIARLISTSLLLGVLKFKYTFTPHAELLLTWGGLRGAISVALALSIPEGPEREVILLATYSIVVFSILVQGLTIGRLVNYLIKK